jgi:hypothetical protein
MDSTPISGDPSAPLPPIEVDYNKWGVSRGLGRVKLDDDAVADLQVNGADVREGTLVHLVDHDADDEGRPCFLEVDGVAHWDEQRGWYADDEQAARPARYSVPASPPATARFSAQPGRF